jgi:hypothetical protein
MTTVLGRHLIWCSGLFGCTVFDVAVSGSSLQTVPKYNQIRLCDPSPIPVVGYGITVRQLGSGVRGGHHTSLQG